MHNVSTCQGVTAPGNVTTWGLARTKVVKEDYGYMIVRRHRVMEYIEGGISE